MTDDHTESHQQFRARALAASLKRAEARVEALEDCLERVISALAIAEYNSKDRHNRMSNDQCWTTCASCIYTKTLQKARALLGVSDGK